MKREKGGGGGEGESETRERGRERGRGGGRGGEILCCREESLHYEALVFSEGPPYPDGPSRIQLVPGFGGTMKPPALSSLSLSMGESMANKQSTRL